MPHPYTTLLFLDVLMKVGLDEIIHNITYKFFLRWVATKHNLQVYQWKYRNCSIYSLKGSIDVGLRYKIIIEAFHMLLTR